MKSNGSRHAVAVALALGPALSAAADFEELYARESRDNRLATVAAYRAAAGAGNCAAAKRLGEIYDQGLIGVARDDAESLSWYVVAQNLGCMIPGASAASTPERERSSGADLLRVAEQFEDAGRGPAARMAYEKAARSGNCPAARRLGEIYDKGQLGASRDYAQSLKWYNFARVLGTCEMLLVK